MTSGSDRQQSRLDRGQSFPFAFLQIVSGAVLIAALLVYGPDTLEGLLIMGAAGWALVIVIAWHHGRTTPAADA